MLTKLHRFIIFYFQMRSGNGAGLGKGVKVLFLCFSFVLFFVFTFSLFLFAFWRSTSLLFIPYFGIFVALTEAALLSEGMLMPVMGVLKLTCIVNFF